MGRVGFRVNEQAQEQWGRGFTQELLDRYDLVPQGEGAELIADQYGIDRRGDGRARARVAPARAPRHRGRRVRARDPADRGRRRDADAPTRASGRTRRSRRSAALSRRSAARARITAGNSSQVSDGAAALLRHVGGQGRGARAQAPRANRGSGDARRRPGDDADRPDPGDARRSSPATACGSTTWTSSRSTRPSRRSSWPGSGRPAPISSASTRAAARSRSAIRSAPPAPGWRPRSCTSWRTWTVSWAW